MKAISGSWVDEEAEPTASSSPEWLGRLAHDLRGPIGPLQMAARMLEASRLSSPQVSEMGRTIERQTLVLLRLADELDDVLRIGLGIFHLHTMPCDLCTIAGSAIVQASTHALSTGKEFRPMKLHMPSTPVLVEADEVRLAQLIALLIASIAPVGPEAECSIELDLATRHAIVRLRDRERRIYRSSGLGYLLTGKPPIDPGTLAMAPVIGRHIAIGHEATIGAGDEADERMGELWLRLPVASRELERIELL
jgi:K+-sensing histidine kinase KdpD